MINMDTDTVTLNHETEGSRLGLRRTGIKQNHGHVPEVRADRE